MLNLQLVDKHYKVILNLMPQHLRSTYSYKILRVLVPAYITDRHAAEQLVCNLLANVFPVCHLLSIFWVLEPLVQLMGCVFPSYGVEILTCLHLCSSIEDAVRIFFFVIFLLSWMGTPLTAYYQACNFYLIGGRRWSSGLWLSIKV